MTTTLKPIRQVTTVTMRVTLTDNGVKVSWPDLDSVKAFVYSEQQRLVAGACTVEVDGSDDTVLICTYSADKPQYLGMQKCVIVAEYEGQKSTYDKPAFTFVATTAETLSDGTTIADDTTDVDIDVEDVSSSILAGAIAAALAAAENANDAADDATDAAAEARAAIAAIPDLSNYYNKSQVDDIANAKQDTLVSGTNIKTINGEPILGEGNIEIQGGGSPDAVLFTEQTLTSEQQAQARSNIGAGTSNFSGSYDDLSNKPSIPAAQVNADWNANSGVAQILNKPTIPEAQIQSDWEQSDNTKKDYIKNKPTIPAAQVQSDWGQSDNTQVDFIKNKPSIPAAQVQSDWAEADANEVDFIKNKPTIPQLSTDVVTDRNDNTKAATPKAAYDAVHPAVVNHGTSDTTFALTPNILHIWGEVSSLTLTLATPTDNTVENEYRFRFTSGSTATTLTLPNTVVYDEAKGDLIPEADKIYEVSIEDNIAVWISIDNS